MQTGYSVNIEMVGKKMFCPFNGELTLTRIELGDVSVHYDVSFASGRKKTSEKSYLEAEALGWIKEVKDDKR